ncbi:hypothetical protein TNCV_3231411 [Trichonephila clavipes]|nr:hypothetical protein TNCV_3231411 [Trichonephila clavipes]
MEDPLIAGISLEMCRLRLNIANSSPEVFTIPPSCANSKSLSQKASPNIHLLAPKASTVAPSSMMGFSSTRCNNPLQPKLESFPTKIPCHPLQLNDGVLRNLSSKSRPHHF